MTSKRGCTQHTPWISKEFLVGYGFLYRDLKVVSAEHVPKETPSPPGHLPHGWQVMEFLLQEVHHTNLHLDNMHLLPSKRHCRHKAGYNDSAYLRSDSPKSGIVALDRTRGYMSHFSLSPRLQTNALPVDRHGCKLVRR